MKSFLNGSSWISFKIENTQLSNDTTPKVIRKNLKILDEYYSISCELWTYKEMICTQITLEELPEHRRKKRPTEKKAREVEKKKKKHILQIAISVDDSIVFSNQHLSKRLMELFAEVFEVDSLQPYDLFGSPPYDLLLLYKQASKTEKNLRIKIDYFTFDRKKEENLSLEKKFLSKMCVEENNFPHIRKVILSRNNEDVDVESEECTEIKDIRIDDIDMVFQGRSIFMYYMFLEEKKKIPIFPNWIMDCMRHGQTRCIYSP